MLSALDALGSRSVVLASLSPRRAALLSTLGVAFSVEPSGFAEDLGPSAFRQPSAYVAATAAAKAVAVAQRVDADLVVAADTVVVLDGEVLEKPADAAEATAMLRRLSGRRHEVWTAVALVAVKSAKSGVWFVGPEIAAERKVLEEAVAARGDFGGELLGFAERTLVEFAEIGDEDIRAYVDSGEPMDKAGAYGIQGKASCFVKALQGCYFNVVGFPIHRFVATLHSKEFRAIFQNEDAS